MATIKITTIHEFDSDKLLEAFEKSWNVKFDGSRKTQCMLFEDLTFGQHFAPSTAQQIVEAVTHEYVQKNWSGKRTVLRINPKGE